MPQRCGLVVIAYCGSRCDRERGHEDVCCANRWHPSGCGMFQGVARDYLMDVLPTARAEGVARPVTR